MKYIDLMPSVEKRPDGYIEHVSLVDDGLTIANNMVGEIATRDSSMTPIAYREAVKHAEAMAQEHNSYCKCGKLFRVNTSPKLRGVTL